MARSIELLAPAKDCTTARAAIQCGADAVYIGAERFGAREGAGNTLPAIKQVTDFAHQYYAKVYVALNTLLYDDELPLAEKIIYQLYKSGIDGLIIQDVGLLELDLPPMPLIASTQMHNSTPEKVKFWQDVGFSRVILARELTLDQIQRIRSRTSVGLECFIHGALCVSASGQCYMSYALGGRSGNRGQCAQPCRRKYTLKDRHGKTTPDLIGGKDRYLLSLKDLNRSDHLEELIDAGVSSFKIEGRLKDIPYVVNTIGFYRQRLDSILCRGLPARDSRAGRPRHLQKSSSGSVKLNFQPNLEKTFNRGFTDYGLTGKTSDLGSIDTPKSIGEFMGTVTKVEKSCFVLDGDQNLHNADGICFFDQRQNLSGTVVNRVEGRKIYPQKMHGIRVGQKIYRNYDYVFTRGLKSRAAQRKIHLSMLLQEKPHGLVLSGTDEDSNQAMVEVSRASSPRYEGGTPSTPQPALKKESARQIILAQLTKLGNTIFECSELRLETKNVYFLPISQLNSARRELVRRLIQNREANRPRLMRDISRNTIPYPENHLTYMGNVLNAKARVFYHRHGVQTIEPAAEAGLDMSGRLVMTTKYCLRQQLKLCPAPGSRLSAEQMILQDEDGRAYLLKFLCGPCGMEIFLNSKD